VRTIGKHRSTPKIARRLAATASLATLATVGTALGLGSPAFADGNPAPTPSPLGSTTPSSAPSPTTAPTDTTTPPTPPKPVTPVVKLIANHSTVLPGHTVDFTVTEKTSSGTAIAGEAATFYMDTVQHGWVKVATKKLSASGSTTFTAKPNYDHAYRVDFAAVSGTPAYNAVRTPNLTVKVDIGAAIVAAAAKEKGKRYVFGADGPNTFDCSGLVKYVFAKFGIKLPHQANLQKHYGTRVSEKDAQPGDLVFVFTGSYAHHVAIYAGNGTWWEAPHTGASVRHVKIWSKDIEFRRVR
jgi:cell wall-associated NlpC family hydrolase